MGSFISLLNLDFILLIFMVLLTFISTVCAYIYDSRENRKRK